MSVSFCVDMCVDVSDFDRDCDLRTRTLSESHGHLRELHVWTKIKVINLGLSKFLVLSIAIAGPRTYYTIPVIADWCRFQATYNTRMYCRRRRSQSQRSMLYAWSWVWQKIGYDKNIDNNFMGAAKKCTVTYLSS